MHFSTLFTATLLAAADGALAAFQPRQNMNLAVPRAAMPYGSSPYNAFGRRSNTVDKRDGHLKAAADAAAAAATPGAGAMGGVEAPSAGAKVQVVQVGGSNGSLTFSPDDIKAEMGSFVQFQFNPMVSSPPKNDRSKKQPLTTSNRTIPSSSPPSTLPACPCPSPCLT